MPVSLSVDASDGGTELSVLDGQLQTILRGRGSLRANLPPGAYKVVARTGDAVHEVTVGLFGKDQVVRIPELKYSSAAPLANTRTFRAVQAAAAVRNSSENRLPSGKGSAISFFLWDNHPVDFRGVPFPDDPLALGLTIRDPKGESLVDLQEIMLPQAAGGWNWACRTIDLNPGDYRIRLDLPGGEAFEQALRAPKGWILQAFINRRFYDPDNRVCRADLANSVLLLNLNVQRPFNPSDADARLVDLARQGLAKRRQVLADDVLRDMFRGKFRDPMLGILGAHLLLQEIPWEPDPRDNRPQLLRLFDHIERRLKQLLGLEFGLDQLVTNLRHLFDGELHPDVESLALLLPPLENPTFLFPYPPMLHQSWSIIVLATGQVPGLIPPDSVSSRIAFQVLNQEPWLIWKDPAPGDQAQTAILNEYTEALKSVLTPEKLGANLSRPGLELPNMTVNVISDMKNRINEFGGTIRLEDLPAQLGNPEPDRFSTLLVRHLLDKKQQQELVHKLGLPSSSIERLVKEMAARGRPR